MIQYLLRIVPSKQSTGKSHFNAAMLKSEEYRFHEVLDSRLYPKLPPGFPCSRYLAPRSLPLYFLSHNSLTRRYATGHTAWDNDFFAHIPITYPNRIEGDFDRSSLLVVVDWYRLQGW
jgi:hypothetical protein